MEVVTILFCSQDGKVKCKRKKCVKVRCVNGRPITGQPVDECCPNPCSEDSTSPGPPPTPAGKSQASAQEAETKKKRGREGRARSTAVTRRQPPHLTAWTPIGDSLDSFFLRNVGSADWNVRRTHERISNYYTLRTSGRIERKTHYIYIYILYSILSWKKIKYLIMFSNEFIFNGFPFSWACVSVCNLLLLSKLRNRSDAKNVNSEWQDREMFQKRNLVVSSLMSLLYLPYIKGIIIHRFVNSSSICATVSIRSLFICSPKGSCITPNLICLENSLIVTL